MKLYKKDGTTSTVKFDDTWIEIEDEIVETPIGQRLKSELKSEEYKLQMQEHNLMQLRQRREQECFSVINRGALWYNRLTTEQQLELDKWYNDWLNVTNTKNIPEKPTWLKE